MSYYSIHHLLATIYLLRIFSLSLATLSSNLVSSTTSTTRLSGCSGWCCSSSCSQLTQIYFHLSIVSQIKCDAAHPGDDPDGGPDLGVPGEVVLVLLPLLHLGLLQAGLPLPGQAHPLSAQYVICEVTRTNPATAYNQLKPSWCLFPL